MSYTTPTDTSSTPITRGISMPQSVSKLAILGLVLASGGAMAQPVVHLPALGNSGAIANDINDHGDVVGQTSVTDVQGVYAVTWDANHVASSLGAMDGHTKSEALSINNNGQIVGYSEDAMGLRMGTLWDGRGGMVDIHTAIGSLGSSIPWDINDHGVITGQASITPGFAKGFVWDQTNPVVVAGTPSFYQGGSNLSINNSGEIVGSAFFFGDPDDVVLAVPDDRGGYVFPDFGPSGFNFSRATTINNNSMVVGHSTAESTTGTWNAAIFTTDTREPVITLGTLPNLDTSESLDVNDNGMVVGYAWDGTGSGFDPRAWVWADGVMFDLNELLGEDSAFEILSRANAVNAQGDIVGFGRLKGGGTGAFLIEGFTMPSTCIADLNGDGELDFFDVSDFLDAFGAQDPVADINGDRSFDFFDVSDFLDAFGAGCP